MITAGSKGKVNSNLNPTRSVSTLPVGTIFRKWDGQVYTVIEKHFSRVRIRRTGQKIEDVAHGTEVLEVLPANYVEEEVMKTDETGEPDTGSETEKETTVKNSTKAKAKKTVKATPTTAKREGNVSKKKEKLEQPDRKVIKGVTAFKTERAEIPVKAGHFVYDAGKGYGVWDPSKQRRIKWIPKARVTNLVKA